MKGVNLVVLLGRVGADPEVKDISGDKKVARFSVATSEVWTDRDGQKQEKTEWHRVVAWGKLAEICGKYIKKGSAVHIQGKITTRNWEDDQGVKKYSTEIIASQVQFMDISSGGNRAEGQERTSSKRDTAPSRDDSLDMDDQPDFTDPNESDDIPF